MRELQAQLSELDSGRREVAGRPAGDLAGADGGLRWGPGGQDEDRGQGRNRSRTVVARVCGDLDCALGGSVANGCRQAGTYSIPCSPSGFSQHLCCLALALGLKRRSGSSASS